ncbi:MAG TPA: hypothetical protein VFI29_19275 [Hanamia sp.]|nr:hypothetical protein [Hanamia sp.]
MKIILSLFLFLLFSGAQAQKTNQKFSGLVSVDAGIPTGLFSSVYSFTTGVNIGAKYALSNQTSLSATAGYLNFFRKGGGEGISFIPVLGGFQFHFIPDAFVSFEAGAAIPTYAHGGILASIVPAAGYQINPHLSADLNYTGIAQYGFLVGGINLRVSYTF